MGMNLPNTRSNLANATTFIQKNRVVQNHGAAMGFLSFLEGAGGTAVTTHIQSGNILLGHATKDRVALTATLQEALEAACGFPVPVVLRSGAELVALVARCPFSAEDWAEDRRRYERAVRRYKAFLEVAGS